MINLVLVIIKTTVMMPTYYSCRNALTLKLTVMTIIVNCCAQGYISEIIIISQCAVTIPEY